MTEKRQKTLFVALSVSLVLLLIAAAAMFVAYAVLSRDTGGAVEGAPMPEAVRSEAVAPDLAVLTLAGETDQRVIVASLAAGEPETAYAALAYSVLLPESVRAGQWLLMAQRYADSDQARAGASLQAALDTVVLAPTLNDLARGESMLQIGDGLGRLGQTELAAAAYGQAELLARSSLVLLPAQRRRLLNQVIETYRAKGQTAKADAILAELESISAGPGIPAQQNPDHLGALRGSVQYDEGVAASMAARQEAAAMLAGGWLQADATGRKDLTAALDDAVRAEDEARSAFYADSGRLAAADRLVLLHDQIAWLTIKLRWQRGHYGYLPVTASDAEARQTGQELVAAYAELVNTYGQALSTLEPADALPARVALLRQSILWWRLGLFPGTAEAALVQQLDEANRAWSTSWSGAGLVVRQQMVGGRPYYLFATSDLPAPTGPATPAAMPTAADVAPPVSPLATPSNQASMR